MSTAPGRTVLVTGASSGIGRAIALRLAAAGWQVFAGVRQGADGVALAADPAATGRVTPVTLDVTDPQHIADVARTVGAAVGDRGLDALVNNAGIAAAAPLEIIPVEGLRRQLEVNVIGQIAVTQALIPLLRVSAGRIVNITSIAGLVAGPVLGAYSASKFALEALTDTLRLELAPWGIDVVAVEPGVIATPIWQTSARTADAMLADPVLAERAERLYGARMAAAREHAAGATTTGIAPDEVARVVERALTAARPRTRYPVGTDAKLGSAVLRRLPDRLRDRLISSRRSGTGE